MTIKGVKKMLNNKGLDLDARSNLPINTSENNIKLRLNAHNGNKGAKSTKGYKWELIYKKSFKTKSAAMSYEYKFKKDRKKRLSILKSRK